jgi:cell division protease FtsH
MAYLGATLTLPEEDQYTQSKQELLDQITVLMGGREAEELIFEDITSGAAADIEQGTKVSRMMVCTFGMNDKLGVVQYGERSEHIYLGRDITKSEPYSEETAREIDLEIKTIMETCRQRAKKILMDNKDKLEKLSQALLEKETLDVKEIKKLLDIEYEVKEEEDTKTAENPWDLRPKLGSDSKEGNEPPTSFG